MMSRIGAAPMSRTRKCLYQKISRTRPSMTDMPPPIRTDMDLNLLPGH
jgi:hypothetical protein